MKLRPALFSLVFSAVALLVAGCSSSGSGAAAEAGTTADGGSGEVSGRRDGNPGKDMPDGGHVAATETGGAADVTGGVDGGGSAIRDAAMGDSSVTTGGEGGVHEAGGDAPIDAATEAGGLRDAGNYPATDAAAEAGGPRDAGSGSAIDATAEVFRDASSGAKADATASTGNATADRLAIAIASCSPQSPRTVPVGWQMVLVGDKGCTLYAPPGWLTIGAGTPNTFVVEDQSRVTGSSVMAGVDTTGTATCTPHGIATWLFANNQDCVGFKELYWKDSVDIVAGIQLPHGDLIYSCTQGGIAIVGYLEVQIEGTWPLCNLLALAFWMPETQIEARTCTLTQTLNSIQCPQGSTGCEDATCRTDCIAQGNLSGACTSDGSCTCTN